MNLFRPANFRNGLLEYVKSPESTKGVLKYSTEFVIITDKYPKVSINIDCVYMYICCIGSIPFPYSSTDN